MKFVIQMGSDSFDVFQKRMTDRYNVNGNQKFLSMIQDSCNHQTSFFWKKIEMNFTHYLKNFLKVWNSIKIGYICLSYMWNISYISLYTYFIIYSMTNNIYIMQHEKVKK